MNDFTEDLLNPKALCAFVSLPLVAILGTIILGPFGIVAGATICGGIIALILRNLEMCRKGNDPGKESNAL